MVEETIGVWFTSILVEPRSRETAMSIKVYRPNRTEDAK